MQQQERLQKLISQAGLASRREAERWIEQGLVEVNGQKAGLGDKADPGTDRILVKGEPLKAAGYKVYLLLNKPVGYVCTLKDPEGRALVTDLIQGIAERLFPVGRLDLNTEGLILLTNDGEFSQRIIHPRHQLSKTYLVRIKGRLRPQDRLQLEQGVALEDGTTAPARVDKLRFAGQHSWFELTLREGKNRQVRRMCEALGYMVSRLKRIRLDFLTLEGVETGRFRHLTPGEVEKLMRR